MHSEQARDPGSNSFKVLQSIRTIVVRSRAQQTHFYSVKFNFMFIRLLTVAFALCMGSAWAQPGKDYPPAAGPDSHSPVVAKEVKAWKVSEHSSGTGSGNISRRPVGVYVTADEAGAHTSNLLLATLILMGAIALKRGRSGKRDA